MRIALVVAYDEDNVIGINNKLPWNLPEDLKWFKSVTTNNIILMGSNTFDSIGKPLPNRDNLVLSRNRKSIEGCRVFDDLLDAMLYAAIRDKDLYIIGGEEVYKQALPLVDKLYITHVKGKHEGDSFFPELDLKKDWFRISRKRFETHESCIYLKKKEKTQLKLK